MDFSESSKYWIMVASKNHVIRGVEGGFCQANHGKEAPLKRLKRDDWITFYSPKETFEGNSPLRKFTALGQIKDDRVYQVEVNSDFHPFRRNVEFHVVIETSIEPLIPELSFIKNKKSWGYVFRLGLIQIARDDFVLIANHMLPRV
ncbi:MAG: EVE domain-containing protein [Nitrososphaerales archaeon]